MYDKILCIRFGSIGDIVLTLPAIRALRRTYPQAEIHYVSKAVFASVLSGVSEIAKVHTLENVRGGLTRLHDSLAAEHFDLILDLHNNFRSSYLYSAFTGRKIIRVKKYRIQKWLAVYGKRRSVNMVPAWQRFVDTIPTPVETFPEDFALAFPREAEEKAASFFEDATPTLVIAPGSAWSTKEWPIASYVSLAGLLSSAKNLRVLVIGHKKDATVAHQMQSVFPACVDLTGKLSIIESCAVLARASLVLSVDTGMMHVAAGLDRPLLVLFGSTAEVLGFFPVGKKAKVLQRDLSCRPCTHIGRKRCPKKHFRCMQDISPQEVFAEIGKILSLNICSESEKR